MFELISKYKPAGDQPEAIKELVEGINEGKRDQVLLGATGTGKTFTIANVIASVNKPTLVLAHERSRFVTCVQIIEAPMCMMSLYYHI